MAAIWGMRLLFLWAILPDSLSFGLFDESFLETDQCQDTCKNTYALHTYEKTEHLNYCFRGCRLFNIIDFINDGEAVNATKESCAFSCKEAYSDVEDAAACYTGCDTQASAFANTRAKMPKTIAMDANIGPFYPFLYVHNLYTNMIDKLNEQMCIRWTFYIQSDSGSMLVAKSEPFVSVRGGPAAFIEEADGEYKTSNYLETNLAALDNSATPNLKHSQVGPQQGYDMIISKDYSPEVATDWLSCVSKKTGLPRMILSLTIFVSAIMMIWLCFTTAATAPEHHIFTKPQKLSIYGDLDYLKSSDGKALITSMHPQDKMEAAPLPIKIQVHRL